MLSRSRSRKAALQYLPGLPDKPYTGQRSGRDPQPAPLGWIYSALDISIFKPAGVHTETFGGVRITVDYKKHNQIGKLSQLIIPRVDQVLD